MIIWSRTGLKEHDDLWIPFYIGLGELLAFPILMRLKFYALIGGWIAIKSAGSWGGWRTSRTSFTRFLLATILILLISYGLARFVELKS